jgi:membrane-bound metal-dependent hydrolase YbcI (DUF457 family)
VDFVSHALWGGIAFGRRTRKAFLVAAGISVLPDLLTEGLFGILYMLGIGDMPAWDAGHPNITEFPLWAQSLYSATHSLVLFTLAFFLMWAVMGKPVWLVGAWGLHIIIDIPTHSLALFPTPFLWPVSDFKVDGVDWSNPLVLGTNLLLLVVVYYLWRARARRQ